MLSLCSLASVKWDAVAQASGIAVFSCYLDTERSGDCSTKLSEHDSLR